jgi:intein/homing endonuclease
MSKTDSVRLYKTRKIISELASKEGRGTELVSLYIPPRKPIHEVIAYLRNEWGTAGNIKSDTTRTHVQDALTKTMQRLKLYKETPENGLVIFAGALPTNGPGSEVVKLYEVTPPKSVRAFVYTCVAPDTRILLDDGMEKTIGALKSSWTNEKVMSWSEKERRLVSNSVQDYLNIPVGGRKTYRLTVESGRSILATEDHPFWTPRGWIRLGELRKGDIVCVLPLADICPIRSTENKENVILDEESIRKISDPPKNMPLVLRRLRERGFLPLTSQNPKLILIARLLGHLFSDGSMVHKMEERPSGGYSYFAFDLCVGSKADEDELRNDLGKLGYELPEGREVTYTMNVEGREYTAYNRHAKLRDGAICTLLRALGAPVGDKVKNGTNIPAWLMESPLTVQREFLAAYLGGDGIMPRIVGRSLVSRSGVGFHRTMQRKKSGLVFANQLEWLLSNFGVVINAI